MRDAMLVTEDGETRIVEYQNGVWQHHCGSQLFFILDDGTFECSRCKEPITCMTWTKACRN